MRGGEGTVSTVPLSHDASHVVAVRLPRSSERFCTGYDFFYLSTRRVGYTIDWWEEGGRFHSTLVCDGR